MTSEHKMTDATTKALREALDLAVNNGHALAEPLHLATVLFGEDDSLGARICFRADNPSSPLSSSSTSNNPPVSIDVHAIRRSFQRLLLKKPSQQPAPTEASPSSSLGQLIQRAGNAAKANGDALIALDHLLVSLYDSDRDVKTNKH